MSPKIILTALRPKQWTKNLVLFAGLIFSQNLGHPVMLAKTLASFALFCLLSGSVYIFNDLADKRRIIENMLINTQYGSIVFRRLFE